MSKKKIVKTWPQTSNQRQCLVWARILLTENMILRLMIAINIS